MVENQGDEVFRFIELLAFESLLAKLTLRGTVLGMSIRTSPG